ncbi:cilia- and flagella-associated protein 69-like [Acanthaster planci]|uniref:Cilia- and flagella-associated protein 69-like n=1 Tax=Acanthaster planci TaxID=133434 RepID=A0A8B7XXA0_ACAPL|nr:cilia- and flagella-associated protein 69-like [Acanthaster planci]
MASSDVQKTPLPVVKHVIGDDDMGIKKGVKIQVVNYSKVIKLLTDPHSVTLYERHLNALQKLIRHYQVGFLMKDLVQVFKILNVCADRVQEQPLYIQPMMEILKIAGLPFLKEKTSDGTAYAQIVVESISQLGYLMRVPSKEVRLQLASTLLNIFSNELPKQEVQDHQASSRAYNMAMVEKSDVAETLVKSLALLEQDIDVKLHILDLLQNLSAFSAPNCDKMLAAEAASRICSRMNDAEPTGRLLFRSIEILWNLLENGNKEEIAEQLSSFICIKALQEAFSQQMTSGFSHYDRQLRNDLLVIATLIATVCPQAPFIETGFAKQLLLFATFQEVRSHNVLVRHLKLGTSIEDFELKKLLINIIIVLSKDVSMVPLLAEGHILLALFSYVRGNENVSQHQEWTPAQFEEVQLHAMSALCTVAPLCVQDYMTCQGNTRLLLLLEWCVGKEDFAGHGNAFHGYGGRGNKRAQMRYCLHLMRSIVSIGEASVNQDFVDQGAINQILDILLSASHSESDDDVIDVEMQSDMLSILSILCEGDIHRKELFGEKGVKVVLQYLKTNPKKLCSGLGYHRMMLATVDSIWCCVVGAYLNEDLFLEGQGVFFLLDLLQTCSANMHNLILGCLLDLCENAKTVAHMLAWKSDKNTTVASLLIKIWKQEEQALGVARNENGTIADTRKPLMGVVQEKAGIVPLPANSRSQAIVDVFENMRAKIYALFCKIGFDDHPSLSTSDQVVVCIIEKYLDFKQGEVWKEVTSELEQEGVRPVTPDEEALSVINRTTEELAINVADTQVDMLETQLQQDLLEEQEMYAEIRENHRQKEKAIKRWNNYVARTSNYSLLKAAKTDQDLSINASRVQTDFLDSDTYHSTDLANLQTTTFQSRHVNIDSTPLELTGGPTLLGQPNERDITNRVTMKENTPIFVS